MDILMTMWDVDLNMLASTEKNVYLDREHQHAPIKNMIA